MNINDIKNDNNIDIINPSSSILINSSNRYNASSSINNDKNENNNEIILNNHNNENINNIKYKNNDNIKINNIENNDINDISITSLTDQFINDQNLINNLRLKVKFLENKCNKQNNLLNELNTKLVETRIHAAYAIKKCENEAIDIAASEAQETIQLITNEYKNLMELSIGAISTERDDLLNKHGKLVDILEQCFHLVSRRIHNKFKKKNQNNNNNDEIKDNNNNQIDNNDIEYNPIEDLLRDKLVLSDLRKDLTKVLNYVKENQTNLRNQTNLTRTQSLDETNINKNKLNFLLTGGLNAQEHDLNYLGISADDDISTNHQEDILLQSRIRALWTAQRSINHIIKLQSLFETTQVDEFLTLKYNHHKNRNNEN